MSKALELFVTGLHPINVFCGHARRNKEPAISAVIIIGGNSRRVPFVYVHDGPGFFYDYSRKPIMVRVRVRNNDSLYVRKPVTESREAGPQGFYG